MNYPHDFDEIIKDCVNRYPDDDNAADHLLIQVCRLPAHEQCILPDAYYTLPSFYARSPVSATRRSEARRSGIELTTLSIGKRKMVRGSGDIKFLEQLAAMDGSENVLE